MANPERVTYRLIGEIPLLFTFLGTPWRFEIGPVNGSNCWRCMLEGPKHWFVTEAKDETALLRVLLETGFEYNPRTFVGTVLQRLAQEGLAERIHPSASAS
ncbi:MAG: hypothetical protein ABIZ04_20895 [Opitutus sp.]